MYILTTIRINNDTKVFENTEENRFMTENEVINELTSVGVSNEQLTRFHELARYCSLTIQTVITTGIKRGTRFVYIHNIG
jgi:hypothetical protein